MYSPWEKMSSSLVWPMKATIIVFFLALNSSGFMGFTPQIRHCTRPRTLQSTAYPQDVRAKQVLYDPSKTSTTPSPQPTSPKAPNAPVDGAKTRAVNEQFTKQLARGRGRTKRVAPRGESAIALATKRALEPLDLGRFTSPEVSEASAAKAHEVSSSTETDAERKLGGKQRNWVERMGSAPLLTAEQELELGVRVQHLLKWVSVQNELEETLQRKPTLQEWHQAATNGTVLLQDFAQRVSDGHQAKSILVRSNLRLVMAVANQHVGMGLSYMDMIQEGTIGLIRATDKYDPTRGFRFATYSTWWIKQHIMNSIALTTRLIRVPLPAHREMMKIKRTKIALLAETGQVPSDEDVALRLGMTLKKYKFLSKASQREISSETGLKHPRQTLPQSSQRLLRVEDRLASDDQLPEDKIFHDQLRNELYDALNDLDEDEYFVIKRRFGLENAKRMKMRDIAAAKDDSYESIVKIQHRALGKLRGPENFQSFDDQGSIEPCTLSEMQQHEVMDVLKFQSERSFGNGDMMNHD